MGGVSLRVLAGLLAMVKGAEFVLIATLLAVSALPCQGARRPTGGPRPCGPCPLAAVAAGLLGGRGVPQIRRPCGPCPLAAVAAGLLGGRGVPQIRVAAVAARPCGPCPPAAVAAGLLGGRGVPQIRGAAVAAPLLAAVAARVDTLEEGHLMV